MRNISTPIKLTETDLDSHDDTPITVYEDYTTKVPIRIKKAFE